MSRYGIFWYPKDPVPAGQKANVVYNIPCLSCPRSYIGQTARLLDTRVREHKAAVKKGETATSAVAEHVWKEHHQMDFNNVTILAREANKDQRCCLESWFIQRNSTINRELGTLPSVYNSAFLVKFYIFSIVVYIIMLLYKSKQKQWR